MAGDKKSGENTTVLRAKRASHIASPTVYHSDHDTDGEERQDESIVVENSSSISGDGNEHVIEGSGQPLHTASFQ